MNDALTNAFGWAWRSGGFVIALLATFLAFNATARAEEDYDMEHKTMSPDVRDDTEGTTKSPMPKTDTTVEEKKDREGVSIMGQSNEDVDLTRRVRREIVKDDALSMSAKNIKIVSNDGVVTLQGSVASMDEEERVLSKVKQLNGVVRVENRLKTK